jgi:predicted nucleic acid-binding protein
MSKSKEAEDLFRADPKASVKEVAEKVGITMAHCYAVRRKVIGPVYGKNRRKARVSTGTVLTVVARPETSPEVEKMENSNILLQAQLNEAIRELSDLRAVIRYLEKKIADAV